MAEFKQKLNTRTAQFNLIPTNIVLEFKAGVATQADLPLTGNAKGDARIENEFGHLYVWSIDASSGLLTDWVDAGDIVDLNWSAIAGKPSSAVADIDNAVSIRHTHPITSLLYVDKERTDIYTPDGSITKPFLTIQEAVNIVPTYGGKINIGCGVYTETITITDKNISLVGQNSYFNFGGTVTNGLITITDSLVNIKDMCIDGGVPVVIKVVGNISKLIMDNCNVNGLIECAGEFVGNHLNFEAGTLKITGTSGLLISKLHDSNIIKPGDEILVELTGADHLEITDSIIIGYNTLSTGVVYANSTGNLFIRDTTVLNLSGTKAIVLNSATGVALSDIFISGDIDCNAIPTVIEGLNQPVGTLTGSVISYRPASKLTNDSSVIGITIKDALNTLDVGVLDLVNIKNSECNTIARIQTQLQKTATVIHTDTDPDSLNTVIQTLADKAVLEVNSSVVYNPISIPGNKELIIRPTLGKCIHLTGTECIKLMNGARDTIIAGVSIQNCTTVNGNYQGAGITFGEIHTKVSNISFYNISIDTVLAGSGVMLSYHWSEGGDNYATANTISECSSEVRFINCCFYKANKDNTEGGALSLRGIIGSFIVNCHFRDDALSMRQIQLQNCISSYVANNNIRNTAVAGTNSEGIKLDELGTCTFRSTGYILNNTIKNAVEGIDIDDKVDALVFDNICYECTEEGISIDDSATAVIGRNLCYNCRFDSNSAGIRVEAGAVVSMNQNNCVNNIINYRIQNGYVLPAGNSSSINDIILKDSAKNLIYEGDITTAFNVKDAIDSLYTGQVTNTIYVDNKRVDIYTPNGSITKPFLKIQDAINAVTAPSATNKYLIEISPGAYYSDAIAINKIYITFRSCGVQGARISGAIEVTNPSSPTPEQITFVGLRISGGLTCLASHIAINCVDCNVTGSAWIMNPTIPTDDEYLQVWGGLWYANATLTNVYTYLMGGGYYSTFVATNCEFNINNADINDPFQVTLNGTVIASAYGDRAGNSKFIVNAGTTLNIDADTEGGSVLTLDPAAILNRTTKAANIVNVPAGNIASTDVQAAINELDTEKLTKNAEISIKVFSQNNEPTLVADNNMAIWIDTDDSNKVYLLFRRGTGDQVAVELTI